MYWLFVGYMWLFIHRPFEVWPWLGPFRIERVVMIITLATWIVSSRKGWTNNQLNVAFAFFVFVVLASWATSPFSASGTETVESVLKIGVFYVLLVSCVRDDKSLKFVTAAFLAITALYMSHSLREYMSGRCVYRMGTARMIGVDNTYADPNTFSASLLYALPIAWPFWKDATTIKSRLPVLAYVGLTTVCVLLTGSRTALVGLIGVASLVVLTTRHRILVGASVVALAPLVWMTLPQDRQDRFMTLVDSSAGPASAQASAEGRLAGFLDGTKLWAENPIAGVGPGAFGVAVGHGFQAHNLYGQVLGELGTLGAIALGLVVIGFAANTVTCNRRLDLPAFSRNLANGIAVTVVLLLILGWGGHNLYRYTWMWSGAFLVGAMACQRIEVGARSEQQICQLCETSATAVPMYTEAMATCQAMVEEYYEVR